MKGNISFSRQRRATNAIIPPASRGIFRGFCWLIRGYLVASIRSATTIIRGGRRGNADVYYTSLSRNRL
jgi:hypothetical protein